MGGAWRYDCILGNSDAIAQCKIMPQISPRQPVFLAVRTEEIF